MDPAWGGAGEVRSATGLTCARCRSGLEARGAHRTRVEDAGECLMQKAAALAGLEDSGQQPARPRQAVTCTSSGWVVGSGRPAPTC